MIDTAAHETLGRPVRTASDRPRVPTPTYLTSGPMQSVDEAMAALSDALERSLQEDLACGMVPTVEHMTVDVVNDVPGSPKAFTAVALLLISYEHAV